jgi:hypothetical protein
MFRGDSPACPTPITGRSTLFRLHVRFVRVVRAVRAVRVGEAKLCGRLYEVVHITGPSGCECPRLCVCPQHVLLIFCAPAFGFLNTFGNTIRA